MTSSRFWILPVLALLAGALFLYCGVTIGEGYARAGGSSRNTWRRVR